MATRRGPGLRVATARGGVVNAAFLSGAEGAGARAGPARDRAARAGRDRPLRRRDDDRDDDRRAAAGRHRRGVRAGARRPTRRPSSSARSRLSSALGLAGALADRRAGAAARRGLRRRPAARAHARRRLPAGRVRVAGAAVGVLQAHGLRAAARAAGDRAARHRRRHRAAAARRASACGRWSSVRSAGTRPPCWRRGARRRIRCACGPTAAPRGAICASRGRCFVTSATALLVAQGQIAVFGISDGLAAAGWITLAATLTRYADRADQILATTIYPAIVRVRDRADVLEELFAQGEPADADVGVPVRRRARAVRRRPDAVRARRRVGRRDRAAGRARGRASRCSRWATTGSRSTGRAGSRGRRRSSPACSRRSFALLAVPGALLGGAWGFVAGRRGVHGVRARRCGACTCGGCCRACGWARWRCEPRCRSRWPRLRS